MDNDKHKELALKALRKMQKGLLNPKALPAPDKPVYDNVLQYLWEDVSRTEAKAILYKIRHEAKDWASYSGYILYPITPPPKHRKVTPKEYEQTLTASKALYSGYPKVQTVMLVKHLIAKLEKEKTLFDSLTGFLRRQYDAVIKSFTR